MPILRVFQLICLAALVGCSSVSSLSLPQPEWISTSRPLSRGVFVVAHGLNNTGSVMNPIIQVLNDEGYDCLRITLVGHEGERKKSSSEVWIAQVDQAIGLARQRNASGEVNLLGFSTGAAVELAAISKRSSPPISRIIFFAPALSMKWYTKLIRPLSYLHHIGIPAFTLAPRDYRVYRWPSLGLYRSMIDSIDAARAIDFNALGSTPGLVFLSPEDEFISETGTIDWIAEKKLPWRTEQVVPHPHFSGSWQHLILDEPTIGSEGWGKVKEQLHTFLQTPAIP